MSPPAAAIGLDPGVAPLGLELAAVLEGLKPAGRHTARLADVERWRGGLEALGLAVAVHRPERPAAGYGYLSPAEQDRLLAEPRVHVLYGTDPVAVTALADAHAAGDNEAIGELLGYPGCCVAANHLYDHTGLNDHVRVARVSGGEADWRLNVFLTSRPAPAGAALQLVSHFPCRLTCEASIVQAEARLGLADRVLPELATALRRLLPLPVLLYDDHLEEPAGKTGLCGALLGGVVADGVVLYDRWWPLRDAGPLPAAALDGADVVRSGPGGPALLRAPDRPVLDLPADRWLLTTFAA